MSVPARKSLGQHFLSDPRLLNRIAAASTAGAGDVVLEIGPGKGALTAALLDRGCTVVAIERDERLVASLQQRFTGRNFALVTGDALLLDWAELVAPWTVDGIRWRVVGNIPYYITSPLLERALTAPLPASVTFLVQKEVADRIVAPAGHDDYGALSIGIQAVAHAQRLFTVGKGAFTPVPKVDSAVLHLVPRADPLVAGSQVKAFRTLVTALFSYRRKRMQRAVREALGLSADAAADLLARSAIDPDVRPEVVDVAGFLRLLHALDG
ncbi:MAG: 16S rRNA (adenine(1518)-N(6)/adenine(1519)-N(6))-dimethyltransferase RsmA [Gemmatimonadota bacterium]